VFKKQVNLRLI